jgi:hypothetical protein
MDCSAQSPNLNPIEHLWDELERRLRSRSQCPTSLIALVTALQKDWAAIPAEAFRELVESLSGRVKSCHKGRGWAQPVVTGKYVTEEVG